jgi:protein-L-isoaspartate(D-aspartate) O-methyltransferase
VAAHKDVPRVLLLWPGGLGGGGGNFGVPQLLSIAGAVRQRTGAHVEVVDLDLERGLGRVDVDAIFARGWDLVGISCYSSFDYLKVCELAKRARAATPRAWLVTGGYHPSARPDEMGDPFDFVVVGDGETPMARLVSMLASGKRPLSRVLGPEPTPDPNELPSYDWELLARYRPIARTVASQAEIYLSRGCPYDCAFCMERAKRDTSWRALEPGRALEELHRLDTFLDLGQWTLFIADALFGMKAAWRKELLLGLARKPLRARKVWLLIRLDLLDRDDLDLMARANVGPGFGLESGDPAQLRRIRKAGKLEGYLDKMLEVAGWAHEAKVPFGANIIVGHPGETEQSMRTSAAYMSKLFLGDPRGTMGFLSVDPFRLYPGSPIDTERGEWERETGLRVHRPDWWQDGDQEFLSEWVDPSRELDYRTAFRLRRELFDPIVRAIPERFAYDGPTRDYFQRATSEQVELAAPRRKLHELGLWRLWTELVEPEATLTFAEDAELAAIARARREETVRLPAIAACSSRVREALLAVPRERFVRTEDIVDSAEDRPLALTDDGGSTISAMHAYALSLDALELGEGDALVDLGAGSGYGACVAGRVVGEAGSVLAIEVMGELATWAEANARDLGMIHVRAIRGDAHDVEPWRGATKVTVGFALPDVPAAWIEALGPGGRLVAPVGAKAPQVLTLWRKNLDGTVDRTELSRVLYVGDRAIP